MIIAGIDYSTSSPAICITDTSKGPAVPGNLKWFNANAVAKRAGTYGNFLEVATLSKFNKKSDNIAKCHQAYHRNIWLAEWAAKVLIDNKVEYVLIEAYAMNAVGRITGIAENTGLLKMTLAQMGIEFESPSITAIKLAHAGAGRVPKTYEPKIPVKRADLTKAWMIDAFIEKTGIEFHVAMNLHIQDGKPIEDCIYNKPIDDCVDAYAILLMHPDVTTE